MIINWRSPPYIESMIPERELSPGVLVSSRSNLLAFGVICVVDGRAYFGIAQSYHDLLGWNLKGIKETIGVMIHDCQLAVCVSTPIESLIPELELSLGVLVSSRSNPMAFHE
jgi:hypothetical protein